MLLILFGIIKHLKLIKLCLYKEFGIRSANLVGGHTKSVPRIPGQLHDRISGDMRDEMRVEGNVSSSILDQLALNVSIILSPKRASKLTSNFPSWKQDALPLPLKHTSCRETSVDARA